MISKLISLLGSTSKQLELNLHKAILKQFLERRIIFKLAMQSIRCPAPQEWQTPLTARGIDPTYPASQIFRPWEFDTFCTVITSRAEVLPRAAREASVRESIHIPKVLDRAPAKAVSGNFRQRQLGDHWVFHMCFFLAGGLPFWMFPFPVSLFAFRNKTLPLSDADNAHASA